MPPAFKSASIPPSRLLAFHGSQADIRCKTRGRPLATARARIRCAEPLAIDGPQLARKVQLWVFLKAASKRGGLTSGLRLLYILEEMTAFGYFPALNEGTRHGDVQFVFISPWPHVPPSLSAAPAGTLLWSFPPPPPLPNPSLP